MDAEVGPLKEGVQDRAAEIVIADVLANVTDGRWPEGGAIR